MERGSIPCKGKQLTTTLLILVWEKGRKEKNQLIPIVRYIFLIFGMLLLCGLLCSLLALSASLPLNLIKLPSPASCLDGSPAGYYYRPGNSSVWVVYLEGGGACYSYADCLARSRTTLGSSTAWSPTFSQADNLLSDSPAVNPVFHAAHAVYIPYCTGDAHTGTRAGPLNSSWPFHFSGHLNLAAVLDALLAGSPVHAEFGAATEVLLAGSSAGGLGTLHNADYLASRVPAGVRVRAAPQGGWFFPAVQVFAAWSANAQQPIWQTLAFVNHLYAGYTNPACVAQHNVSYCFTVDHVFAFSRVPTFVAENLVDSNQVFAELLAPTHSPRLPQFLAYFHSAMLTSLAQVQAAGGHGVWAPGCLAHTENLNFAANGTLVQRHAYVEALNAWWLGGSSIPSILVDSCTDPVPCNPSCPAA